jgi:hypothetical protein
MNLKKIILVTALNVIIAISAFADVTTPYSMYGYGILGDRATSMQSQMGGIGVAMNSGRQINVINPASYAAVDSLTFLFDMGADMSMIWSKEGSESDRQFGGGLNYLTMQVPLWKHIGASFGLIPYSSVGYAFGNDISHGAMENQGSGGINELYLGVAGEFKGFSLGVNVSYDFGNIVNDIFTTTSSGGASKFEHVMKIRDYNVVVGAQYTARWSRFNKMVFGLTYSPKKTMYGNSFATTQETNSDTYPDTVGMMKLKGKYFTPHAVGAGISYTYEKQSRIMVEADFSWQGWKNALYSPLYATAQPDKVLFDGMQFNNRTRYAVGAECIPRLRGNYGQRMTYRIGGYFCNDYLNIKGNGVKEMGISAGVGFPTPEGKTMVNLGIEWKQRYASPQTLIRENYLNITLGVNFNEVWFFKRKIR